MIALKEVSTKIADTKFQRRHRIMNFFVRV